MNIFEHIKCYCNTMWILPITESTKISMQQTGRLLISYMPLKLTNSNPVTLQRVLYLNLINPDMARF